MFYVFVLFYVASVLMLYMCSSLIGSTASVTIQFLKKNTFFIHLCQEPIRLLICAQSSVNLQSFLIKGIYTNVRK